jgi:hypothetical protein
MDIYVLDNNLQQVFVVDAYKSLIWANRYRESGDCELYLPATAEALYYLRKGFYLARADDDMVCQIRYIEIDTDVENGNYLIVKGFDVKRWLDQRIIWNSLQANGNAELFIRRMVDASLGTTDIADRKIVNGNGQRIFYLGDLAGFTEVLTEQTTYRNLGDKVRDYCQKYGWGYRVVLKSNHFEFELYAGADRTATVIFSPEYENLATSKYVYDETNMGNVALVGGEGEGSARSRQVSGSAASTERYEIFVDAKEISKTITWAELTAAYPSGTIVNTLYGYVYQVSQLDIQILDNAQLAELIAEYPSGTVVYIDGHRYYRIANEPIADLPNSSPADEDNVVLRDVVYNVYLLTKGYETLAEYGAVTSFDGTIEANTTFKYKRDYFLGDVVTVENEYGISVEARITEIIEVNDDNGYSVQPKYEYVSGV